MITLLDLKDHLDQYPQHPDNEPGRTTAREYRDFDGVRDDLNEELQSYVETIIRDAEEPPAEGKMDILYTIAMGLRLQGFNVQFDGDHESAEIFIETGGNEFKLSTIDIYQF